METDLVDVKRRVTPLGAIILDKTSERGWSLHELSRQASISQPALSKIVNRSPQIVPELPTLSALANALDVPMRDLIEACGFKVDQPDPANPDNAAPADRAA